MDPQQKPSSNYDQEPTVQVPEVPTPPAVAPPDPAASATTPTPAPIASQPAPVSDAPAPVTSPVAPVTTGPATAGDVDVIEKDWVDKANAVVEKTTGDPHAEEAAVEDLQTDYLKKRYNHTVNKSQEG